jgi:sarcosine oxidase
VGERYDAVVVGAGVMGTSTARHLAQRGRRVLVLERFEVGHAQGSSGGPTRIFRLPYHLPSYTRLARRALHAWRALEDESGQTLLTTTGGLDAGPVVPATAAVLDAAGERYELLSAEQAHERWPALRLDPGAQVLYQDEAGVIRAETTVRTQAAMAVNAGAEIRERTVAATVDPAGDAVAVTTTDGERYEAACAVVAAGPWAGPLLSGSGIHLPLETSREQVSYFELDRANELPTVIDWNAERVEVPYGVPDPSEPGSFKAGFHRSGPVVPPDGSGEPDPSLRARAEAFAARRYPGARPSGRIDLCFYTTTPDEDFAIGRIGPIVVASPCSGHGFKFAPLFGEALADLAIGAEPSIDLSMFRLDRAALRRPPPQASSSGVARSSRDSRSNP